MKAASLKLKRGIARTGVETGGELNAKILNFILVTLAALAFLYVLFLGKMVYNIVERRSLESEARILASEVSQLEVLYLSASDRIDLDFSRSLGFKEASPEYAARKSLGKVGILNNEI